MHVTILKVANLQTWHYLHEAVSEVGGHPKTLVALFGVMLTGWYDIKCALLLLCVSLYSGLPTCRRGLCLHKSMIYARLKLLPPKC